MSARNMSRSNLNQYDRRQDEMTAALVELVFIYSGAFGDEATAQYATLAGIPSDAALRVLRGPLRRPARWRRPGRQSAGDRQP